MVRRLLTVLIALVLLVVIAVAADRSLRRSGKQPLVDGWIDAASPPAVSLTTLVDGLSSPVDVTHAGDGSERLFVVEQRGRIRVIEDGRLLAEPFLDIGSRLADENWEQGLFSVAFHPDFPADDRFFIAYTAVEDGRLVLSEHRLSADPNRGDPNGAVLLEVPQPSPEHNGGQLHFGPDGYLYLGVGDGEMAVAGSGRAAQRLDSLLGKILRLDVSEPGGYRIPADNPFVGNDRARPEIYAYGLRNPWRFSFDRAGGELFVGDVGECCIEEITLVEAGADHGWPTREGSVCRTPTLYGWLLCTVPHLLGRQVPPIVEYGHVDRDPRGGQSVTGGYVYRHDDGSALVGRYLFADFLTGRLWSLERRGEAWARQELLDTDHMISSFGEDEAGRLYFTDWQAGAVLRIDPQ